MFSQISSAPPPPYDVTMQYNGHRPTNSLSTNDNRMADFQQVVARYESKSLLKLTVNNRHLLVNHTFATKLRALEGYEIVFVCDDSGSMNTPLGRRVWRPS
jgi:hypothetical protein